MSLPTDDAFRFWLEQHLDHDDIDRWSKLELMKLAFAGGVSHGMDHAANEFRKVLPEQAG